MSNLVLVRMLRSGDPFSKDDIQMFREYILLATGALTLALSSCTSVPKADLHGKMPTGGTFYLAGPAGGSPLAERLIRDRLISSGLTERGNGTYLVQVTLAQRSLSSGMAISDRADWLYAPARSRGQLVQLSVTITRAADGSETFRATSVKRNGHFDEKTIERLIDNIFLRLKKIP